MLTPDAETSTANISKISRTISALESRCRILARASSRKSEAAEYRQTAATLHATKERLRSEYLATLEW